MSESPIISRFALLLDNIPEQVIKDMQSKINNNKVQALLSSKISSWTDDHMYLLKSKGTLKLIYQ